MVGLGLVALPQEFDKDGLDALQRFHEGGAGGVGDDALARGRGDGEGGEVDDAFEAVGGPGRAVEVGEAAEVAEDARAVAAEVYRERLSVGGDAVEELDHRFPEPRDGKPLHLVHALSLEFARPDGEHLARDLVVDAHGGAAGADAVAQFGGEVAVEFLAREERARGVAQASDDDLRAGKREALARRVNAPAFFAGPHHHFV